MTIVCAHYIPNRGKTKNAYVAAGRTKDIVWARDGANLFDNSLYVNCIHTFFFFFFFFVKPRMQIHVGTQFKQT